MLSLVLILTKSRMLIGALLQGKPRYWVPGTRQKNFDIKIVNRQISDFDIIGAVMLSNSNKN